MTDAEVADLKANFDYVLEGKDVEIKELKETLAQTIENDEVAYETLKLHDQEEIGMLKSRVEELQEQNSHMFNAIALQEQQIEKLKCCENCKYHSFWGDELKCNYGLKEALFEDKLVECHNKDNWKELVPPKEIE